MNLLADLGFDPQFGARPLKRVIQKEVIMNWQNSYFPNDLAKDESITLDADAKGFTFNGKSTGDALHRDLTANLRLMRSGPLKMWKKRPKK
ncbi:MAG: hypothetical protein IPI90_15795 [Saprospiraceae bacterium]|nr:hypothetical protein [Candidatus Vicinibacter affinis]